MNRTLVCVETTDHFTRALGRVTEAEGDRLLFVSAKPASREGIASACLNVRDEPTGVAAEIHQRCGDLPAAAVVTDHEMFVTAAAAIADALGVSGNTLEAMLSARDKARMKEAWLAANVRTPRGSLFRSRNDLDAARIEYPAIVKPTLGFASCGVRRVCSPAELLQQVRKISLINATVVTKEGVRGAGFLVEECLDGPEYSVDTVWSDGEPVCDGLLSRGGQHRSGPYYPDRLYVLDQSIPEPRRRAILDLTHDAVRALGIRFGPTHTEVRFRGDTPYVLETAARPGGGGRFYDLFERAHGADFTRAMYLSLVCGSREELDERLGPMEWLPVDPDTSYYWYHLPHAGAGVIKEIVGLDRLRGREDVLVCDCFKAPGNHLYAELDLNTEYFCSIIGRYVRKPGDPTVEAHVATYDGMVEVRF